MASPRPTESKEEAKTEAQAVITAPLPRLEYTEDDIKKLGGRIPLHNGFYIKSTPGTTGFQIMNPSGDAIEEDKESLWPIQHLTAYSSGLVLYRAYVSFGSGNSLDNKSFKIEHKQSEDSVKWDFIPINDYIQITSFHHLSENRFLMVETEGLCGLSIGLKLFDSNESKPVANCDLFERSLGPGDGVKSVHLIRPNVLLVHFTHESRFLEVAGKELKQIGASYPYNFLLEEKNGWKPQFLIESSIHEDGIFSVFKQYKLAKMHNGITPKNITSTIESAHRFYEDTPGNFIGTPLDVEATNTRFEQATAEILMKARADIPADPARLIASYARPADAVSEKLVTITSPLLMWKMPATPSVVAPAEEVEVAKLHS